MRLSARLSAAAGVALLAAAAACATNPATGQRQINFMSEAQEIQVGQQNDPEIRKEMGVYDDRALIEYVTSVGAKMAALSERPNLPWHFTVVDQPAINAFAVPGGYIYFTRGILPFLNNEAEMAGVMGHEIGHITARHSAQQYTRSMEANIGLTALSIFVPQARPFGDLGSQALGVMFLKYGRDDESQADQLGVRYTSRAGWDPGGIASMLNTLARLDEASGQRRGVPNWLSTHPASADRVVAVQGAIQQAKAGGETFTTNRDEFLRHIDGIIYGDNPEQGIARGSTFLHPSLRFRLDFPDGWEIENSPQQVVAKLPGTEDAIMLLELVEQPNGRTIDEVAVNQMRAAGFRQLSGAKESLNGDDAYVGTYQGNMQPFGAVTMRAAHIGHGTSYYLLAGIAKQNVFQQNEAAFLKAIRSFRPLSASEAEGIRPNTVDIYVVRTGDTWQSIAQKSGGVIRASTLAIMNDYEPSSVPRVGERIKIVVGG